MYDKVKEIHDHNGWDIYECYLTASSSSDHLLQYKEYRIRLKEERVDTIHGQGWHAKAFIKTNLLFTQVKIEPN